MARVSRRQFLQWTAVTGGALAASSWIPQASSPLVRPGHAASAPTGDPIKIGIIDPLSSPYKTSSIHDVHGATVAIDAYHKRGGILGRPVTIIEADDASQVETGVRAAMKLIAEDRVDVLMGTFNGDVALAIADLARQHDKLFMVTCSHIMELTGARCNSHTFAFMPNARMLSESVAPELVKLYGPKWYAITAETVDGRSAHDAMARALKTHGGEAIGQATTVFGATDFSAPLNEAKAAKPNGVLLNLYGWDLVNALKAYTKLELGKEKIGVGGMIGGEQIGRPLGYANNAGVWGLVWDPKVDTDSSRRFIQGVIDKYNHTPTSRCYLGYAAMTQILEAINRAGTTETAALIKALEGHEFDGLKKGPSTFRASDHQCVQDVLVGQAYGKELGLGHYRIVATVPGDLSRNKQTACALA